MLLLLWSCAAVDGTVAVAIAVVIAVAIAAAIAAIAAADAADADCLVLGNVGVCFDAALSTAFDKQILVQS